MSIKKLAYTGSSKIIKNLVNTVNALIDQGGGGSGGSDHHYSTSEQKIGLWIDDRPVYEKTIIVPGPFSNNQISVAHGITDLDDVINYRGFFRNRGSNYNERRFVPQLYYNDMQYIISVYHITDTDMLIVYGNWLRQYATVSDIYIILQYTKTTD